MTPVLIAVLPLMLLAANALHPQPSRGAEWPLALGALLGAVAVLRFGLAGPRAEPWWRRPWFWALAAWALMATSLAWSLHPTLGCIALAERLAALALALGLAAACAGERAAGAVRVLAVCGAGILVLAALSGVPAGPYHHLGNLLLGAVTDQARTLEQPFGLNNFNVGGAAPLFAVAAALPVFTPPLRTRWWAWTCPAVGVAALVVTGLGLGTDHATTASWFLLAVTAGALAAVAVARRLPRRWGAVPLGLFLAVPAAVQIMLAVVLRLPCTVPPSVVYRVGTWGAALRAFAEIPLTGHGLGETAEVVSRGEVYNLAYLAVPSFAEHAHSELLETLVTGGLAVAVPVCLAVFWTMAGLWRRRRDPLAAVMLTAWLVAVVHALIESHLSQPGPLLCLALLAGASWAVCSERAVAPAASARLAGPVVVLAALASAAGIAWTGWRVGHDRGPAGIDFAKTVAGLPPYRPDMPHGRRLDLLRERALAIQALTARIGYCHDLHYLLANHLLESGGLAANRSEVLEEARAEALAQGRRMPAMPPGPPHAGVPFLLPIDRTRPAAGRYDPGNLLLLMLLNRRLGRWDAPAVEVLDRAAVVVERPLLEALPAGSEGRERVDAIRGLLAEIRRPAGR